MEPEPIPRYSWFGMLAQSAMVAIIAFIAYTHLYSELPVDDTSRFTQSVGEGRFEWDATHLWMQPATVFWHRYVDWTGDPLLSQHHINSFAAAVSLGMLYLLASRLRRSTWESVLLVAGAGSAYHLLTLATSGHMKLIALPFLTVSMLAAMRWEFVGPESRWHARFLIIVSGGALAIATLCLANSLFILPMQLLVLLYYSAKAKRSWTSGLADASLYASVVLVIVFATLAGAYIGTRERSAASLRGFAGFLVDKENDSAQLTTSDLGERFFRVGYGTMLNFVYMEHLGPAFKARMRGQFPADVSFGALIARDLVFLIGTAVGLTVIYGVGLSLLRRACPGIGATWGAFMGIALFAAYWNLAEADFYYQLTLPTYAMLLLFRRAHLRKAILILMASISIVANMGFWSIPKARYPFQRYASQLAGALGEEDLIVAYYAYPGKPCMAFYMPYLSEVPRIYVDQLASKSSGTAEFFENLSQKLHERPYRKIVIFRILDRLDFNAPVPTLWQKGIFRSDLEKWFEEQGEIVAMPSIAEIPCWELRLKKSVSLDPSGRQATK